VTLTLTDVLAADTLRVRARIPRRNSSATREASSGPQLASHPRGGSLRTLTDLWVSIPMAEDPFVADAYALASQFLKSPLAIRRGALLLYAVTVDNTLQITVDPKPAAGGSLTFLVGALPVRAVSQRPR
jgi:hypothetical protein